MSIELKAKIGCVVGLAIIWGIWGIPTMLAVAVLGYIFISI